MVEAPSLQPQHCEECGRQKMTWTVSTADVSGDQEINTDTKRRNFSLNALFGKQSELTTESSDADGSKNADGDTESFHFCPDVNCKNHLDGVGDVITWKAVNASTKDYSEAEIDQRIAEVLEQTVQDHQTVVENVDRKSTR